MGEGPQSQLLFANTPQLGQAVGFDDQEPND
ncbi:MAG: hypothetical protein RL323_2145, partial [Pseudomonadota bacterium]